MFLDPQVSWLHGLRAAVQLQTDRMGRLYLLLEGHTFPTHEMFLPNCSHGEHWCSRQVLCFAEVSIGKIKQLKVQP
jgi:hypothetical protein